MVEKKECKEGSPPMMPPQGTTQGDDPVVRDRLLQSIRDDNFNSIGDQLETHADIDRRFLKSLGFCNGTGGDEMPGIEGQVAQGCSVTRHGYDGSQIGPYTAVEEKCTCSIAAEDVTPSRASQSLFMQGSACLCGPCTQQHYVPYHPARASCPATPAGSFRPLSKGLHERYSMV